MFPKHNDKMTKKINKTRKNYKRKFIDLRTYKILGIYDTREDCRIQNKLSPNYMRNFIDEILTDVLR